MVFNFSRGFVCENGKSN